MNEEVTEDVKEKIYSTRALPIAAFLFSRPESEGINLVGFDDADVRNIMFEFTPYEKCVELSDAYLMNKIDCKPKKIMDAHATLKEKVFMIQRASR